MKPWIDLLRPHRRLLTLALLAAIGEAITDIAQPWPLKIVLDNVLHHHSMHGTGWLNHLILAVAGTDHWAVLRLATLVALAIDILQIIDC